MRRYQNRRENNNGKEQLSFFPRKVNKKDGELFQHRPRNELCLYKVADGLLRVVKQDHDTIEQRLSKECLTIEHQIILLRSIIQLKPRDFHLRCKFTELFLTCLYRHHKIIYEGILFGSTINGLGFCDSDVDLRLRPLQEIGTDLYEPIKLDKDMIDRVLRDIAYQTTRCCPASGAFVPSNRVPVAKLVFLDVEKAQPMECLKYDISLSSTNPFGTLNSRFLRFLCHLEPKFHLLATALRYWSTVHGLILPGYLSSYALVSMLIFFCQTIEPPLLPTIDHMRNLELDAKSGSQHLSNQRGLTQAEWNCIVCLDKERYSPSVNSEPLSVLLLKFFEFYLNFPHLTHLITTRPGKALAFDVYESSSQYHPRFKRNPFLNIQDPFDLAHNLTSGMGGHHFRLIMLTMRHSYERLFRELLNNFSQPPFEMIQMIEKRHNPYNPYSKPKTVVKFKPWGLLTIFTKLTEHEKKIG